MCFVLLRLYWYSSVYLCACVCARVCMCVALFACALLHPWSQHSRILPPSPQATASLSHQGPVVDRAADPDEPRLCRRVCTAVTQWEQRNVERERERERERETIIITHTCKHADAHNLSPPLVLSFQVCWSEAVHKRRPSVDAAGLQTISQSHPKVYSNQVCIASPLSLFPQMGFHSPFLPLDTHMHSHTLTHSLTHAHAHPLSHTHTHTLSCAPSACSCRPNMDLVQNYITAFYLSEADFEAWLHKHHQRHTPKQLTQLVNHTFAQNKKTRQRLVKLVTELMQAPVTQPQ